MIQNIYERIATTYGKVQDRKEERHMMRVIDDFSKDRGITAKDILELNKYIHFHPESPVETYLNQSPVCNELKDAITEVTEIVMEIAEPYKNLQDIMSISYNIFHDGIKKDRHLEIVIEFYERMRHANRGLERNLNIIPKELEQIMDKINKYTINHKTQDIASIITAQEINS